MPAKGKFIVFEGCDGSGLSTCSRMFADYLRGKGYDVLLTKEATDSVVGSTIKNVFLKGDEKLSPLALQLLFCADRANHLEIDIEPALSQGRIVVCDRYVLSTLAFGSLGCDLSFLKKVNADFRKPDLIFVIDVPTEVSLERIQRTRGGTELFEKLETLKKVRANYFKLKSYFKNTFIVNNNRPLDEASQEIKKIAGKVLKL